MTNFAAGQVWKYKTRANEEASRVIVCRVEANDKAGHIVHIFVGNLQMKSQHAPEGVANTISHMPFSEEAVQSSVTELEGEIDVPDFQEGYAMWKGAFDKGEAGYFTGSIAESVDFMGQAMNQ